MLEQDLVMTDNLEASLSPLERAFAGTVFYSSLFQFPLTQEEVKKTFLEANLEGVAVSRIYSESPILRKIIEFRQGYYFPVGKASWIQLREERRKRSEQLLRQHRFVLKLICVLPFTRLVALSGSIAHLNVGDHGDVDLLLITEGRHVWSTAVAAILLAKIMGCRDHICVNFVLSDSRLEIEKKDLFSANQMIFLRPMFGFEAYEEFLERNHFVFRFYPNFFPETRADHDCQPGHHPSIVKRVLEVILDLGFARVAEWLCRSLYQKYLISKSTDWTSPEEVELAPDRLKLHTYSHRTRILSEFERRIAGAMKSLS